MKRYNLAGAEVVAALILTLGLPAPPAAALSPQQDQQQQQQRQPAYTIAEYNSFTAASKETNPTDRIKLLDDFVSKFPKSALLPYAYQTYLTTYNQLKNYPKVIEYADKLTALDDKVQLANRLQAIQLRSQVFEFVFNAKAPDAQDQLTKARDAAAAGLKLLDQFPKPQNTTDQQFAEQKKPGIAFFNSAAGFAELQLKDYKAAIASFKAALANKPDDPVSYYRLGLAYLGDNPPETMDGFWTLARAVDLKVPGQAQVRDYLRKQILIYQQTGCDSLVDAQLNELLSLAANSPDRPATYKIPSLADLNDVRQHSTILTVLNDLGAGGDKTKTTWLAVCGSEFPEVVGKIIDVTPGSGETIFHVYTSASEQEMQKATAANMDVKVPDQPEAARLQKDDGIRFSGMIVGYDPSPFMLHWDKCKVDPTIIPPEKPGGGKRHSRRIPHRKPGKK